MRECNSEIRHLYLLDYQIQCCVLWYLHQDTHRPGCSLGL